MMADDSGFSDHETSVLLELWQCVPRHAAIGGLPTALPTGAKALARVLPLAGLEVLVPDAEAQVLRRWRSSGDFRAATPDTSEPLPPAEIAQFSAWCATAAIEETPAGECPRWLDGLPRLARWLDGADPAAATLLALGLAGANGHGVLVLARLLPGFRGGRGEREFLARSAECLRTLLDWSLVRSELAGLHELVGQLRERGRSTEPAAETIVGADGGLRPVLARVRLVAGTDVPVLILGETGSGKEVVARAIHQGSARAHEPFVRVNCGALPAELIDSELFGHERGAFTGASTVRRGWFEQADRGTLFLDEIGELPLAAQVRLLRVLQDGTLNRIGSESSLHVDVRVVAATHRDLPSMVLAGRFREDLWYRLATFPVLLPPLRERREDFAELAAHFARRAAHRFGFPVVQPTVADVSLLDAYDWPGNVREFAAVIDRALLLGEGRRLDVATALGAPLVRAATTTPSAPPAASHPVLACAFPTLDEAMRVHIERALELTGGRIEGPRGAARLLDINPHTLRARMRKLGVEWAQFRGD